MIDRNRDGGMAFRWYFLHTVVSRIGTSPDLYQMTSRMAHLPWTHSSQMSEELNINNGVRQLAMATVYLWVVWLHLVGIFGFLLTHGASAMAMINLRKEREVERIRALLDLSRTSLIATYIFILLILASGITAGFLGNWWGQLWIWTAIGVGFTMMVSMYYFGTQYFNKIRKAAGLPYVEKRKKQPPLPAATPGELNTLLSSGDTTVLVLVGVLGLVVIVWLMVFKPF